MQVKMIIWRRQLDFLTILTLSEMNISTWKCTLRKVRLKRILKHVIHPAQIHSRPKTWTSKLSICTNLPMFTVMLQCEVCLEHWLGFLECSVCKQGWCLLKLLPPKYREDKVQLKLGLGQMNEFQVIHRSLLIPSQGKLLALGITSIASVCR